MKRYVHILLAGLWIAATCHACMKYGPEEEIPFDFSNDPHGVFITNEGNFMYGNASLSYYIPDQKEIENEVFSRANGISLGDVAQSMNIRDGSGYIVVNNSGIVFVIDVNTFKIEGYVSGLLSPRYIHFINDSKAYITDLYASRITVFNPRTLEITGHIPTEGHRSTEQMVQFDQYVFTNCWAYDNKILVIDAEKDQLIDSIEVGIQPVSIAIDKYDKLWVLTDGGGYSGNPAGYTAPSLYRIDAASRKIEQEFTFNLGDAPSELALNGKKDTLYFINKSVWRMDVTDRQLPQTPFLQYNGTLYYGLAVDPFSSEVYVADAIDYVQPGVVYRFTPEARPLDTLRTGITPGTFCFK